MGETQDAGRPKLTDETNKDSFWTGPFYLRDNTPSQPFRRDILDCCCGFSARVFHRDLAEPGGRNPAFCVFGPPHFSGGSGRIAAQVI